MKAQGMVLGVAAAVPGTVNVEEGIVLKAPNVPSLDGFRISAALKNELNLPCFLENDANAATVGENWLGASKDVQNSILVTLGAAESITTSYRQAFLLKHLKEIDKMNIPIFNYCFGRLRASRGLGRAALVAYVLQGMTTGLLELTPLDFWWKALLLASYISYLPIPPLTWRLLENLHGPEEQHS